MDPFDWQSYYEGLRKRRAVLLKQLITLDILMMKFYSTVVLQILQPPEPTIRLAYHTSALTGAQWVAELTSGHPRRIRTELGVTHNVFQLLLDEMRDMGCTDSRHVSLEEQLAIFLYMSVTGNTIRHAGERFQRSNGTIAM